MTTLSIKNFNVLNTTNGKMPITGRIDNNQLSNILSYKKIINEVIEGIEVPGTPDTISSGGLQGISHMATSYIKIITDFKNNSLNDEVFIPDNFIRITYVGGTTGASNSLIYGFCDSNNTPIENITWNVAFAKNTSQTAGDYIDVPFPDMTYYPSDNFYISFILLNSAWDNRIIIRDNICSITNLNAPNFCINPSKSLYDINKSHFINIKGSNTFYGYFTRITFGSEDWHIENTDKDYNDFSFSISSRFNSELNVNENIIS